MNATLAPCPPPAPAADDHARDENMQADGNGNGHHANDVKPALAAPPIVPAAAADDNADAAPPPAGDDDAVPPLPNYEPEVMSLAPGETVTPEWARRLELALDAATRTTTATSDPAAPPNAATSAATAALRRVLPARVLAELVARATKMLRSEPTLVELSNLQQDEHVVVVGDTHGQFHDLRRLFATAGYPCEEGKGAPNDATTSTPLPPVLVDPRALCADLATADPPAPLPPPPSCRLRTFVFNGDYVDRGAWGVELLALVLAWKCALPRRVVMLRGNHESATCTRVYGFFAELAAKYGAVLSLPVAQPQQPQEEQQPPSTTTTTASRRKQALPPRRPPGAATTTTTTEPTHKELYTSFRRLFATMPLAALIAGRTLVLHGGLFRAPPSAAAAKAGGGGKKKGGGAGKKAAATPATPTTADHAGPLRVGTVAQLRAAPKGGQDPDGFTAASRVAADVLWSDPVLRRGLRANTARGVGCVFGPDVTLAFLRREGLELVIRSHEGPDARDRFSDDEEEDQEKAEKGVQADEQQQEEQEEEDEDDEPPPPPSSADEDDDGNPARRDYGNGLRAELGPMLDGYSIDHVTPAGVLMTVFSAPDYPQFQAEEEEEDQQRGEEEKQAGDDGGAPAADGANDPLEPPPPARRRGRYNNLASVALLTGPTWASARMLRFAADLPRPAAPPYYDFDLCMAPSEEGEELAAELGPVSSAGGDGGMSEEEEEEGDEEEGGGGGGGGGKRAASPPPPAAGKRRRSSSRAASGGVAAVVAAETAAAGDDDDSDYDPAAAAGGGGSGGKRRRRAPPKQKKGAAVAAGEAAVVAAAVQGRGPHLTAGAAASAAGEEGQASPLPAAAADDDDDDDAAPNAEEAAAPVPMEEERGEDEGCAAAGVAAPDGGDGGA
jgi:serine/threonine-protein phosphatase 5